MKVLIADDENLVRSSLISMLEELNYPLEIVGEATNGEEMVSLVRKYAPDIAFVDIRMPRLNGLEAIKAARKFSPDTQWIILTGFSEFDYAKEAIKLGASNYLLKPASPEELREVLDKSIKRNKEYNAFLNKEFENEITALIHEISSLPDDNEMSFISRAKFIGAVLIFDSHLAEKSKAELQLKFCNLVRSNINKHLTSEVKIALFPMPSGEIATVGAWDSGQNTQGREMIHSYFETVTDAAARFSTSDFLVTVLQSDEYTSFEMLHKGLHQLQNLSPMRIVMASGRRLTLRNLSRQYKEAPSHLLELCSEITKLSLSYKEKIYLNYMQSLAGMEKSLRSSAASGNDSLKKCIADFILHSINCKLETIQDVKIWLKILHKHGEQLLAGIQKEEAPAPDAIDQVISFIEQNYVNDIGIAQIAEILGITPNYLSSLFHKKTGTTFMKYLTRFRMLKAKELLSTPNAQVQYVAERVGYFSTRHFTRLFKEYFDCYPSEYRDGFKNK